MAMTMTHDSTLISLRALLNCAVPEDWLLRLYVNAISPQSDDTAERYQEARGHGYEPILLRGSLWRVKGADGASYPRQTFRFTGSLGELYGYYVTQAKSGILLGAELFKDGPYRVGEAGGVIGITLEVAPQSGG